MTLFERYCEKIAIVIKISETDFIPNHRHKWQQFCTNSKKLTVKLLTTIEQGKGYLLVNDRILSTAFLAGKWCLLLPPGLCTVT